MSKAVALMSMSLDGYVADPDDGVAEVFAWYFNSYVVSSTLDRVDWNAELVRGDLGQAVQQLKAKSGKGLLVGGVTLTLALTELGLIDEYEFVGAASGRAMGRRCSRGFRSMSI